MTLTLTLTVPLDGLGPPPSALVKPVKYDLKSSTKHSSHSWKIGPLALVLALAAPSLAGETQVLLGPSFGALRSRPRRIIASLEVDHQLDDSPFGVWGALDGMIDDGQFLGVGPLLKVSPGSGWMLAAGSGPGYYMHESGPDLGFALEFRSTFYIAHRLGNAGWLGTSISHYSNAHLRTYNPGAETVRLFWSFTVPWR